MRPLLLSAIAVLLLATACGADSATDAGSEPTTIRPILIVDHVDDRRQEIPPAVHLGADGQAELRQLVAELDPAAELSSIDEADPEEHFFVVAGYYCTDGDRVLDVTPTELETRLESLTSCEAPNPHLSVFRVARADVEPTFDLLDRPEWADEGSLVVQVVDWTVVG